MNIPQNVIIHHTASVASPGKKQYEAVRKYHLGKGWGDGTGYHIFIEESGEVVKGRDEKTAGAHCKEKLMNFRSIGVCLAGHFDIQVPTDAQVRALYGVIRSLQNKYNIPAKNIFPHRNFATYKSCWGSRLPNDIIGYLESRMTPVQVVSDWAVEAMKLAKDKGIVEDQSKPQEPIHPVKVAHILQKLGLLTKIEEEGCTLEQFVVALNRAKLL